MDNKLKKEIDKFLDINLDDMELSNDKISTYIDESKNLVDNLSEKLFELENDLIESERSVRSLEWELKEEQNKEIDIEELTPNNIISWFENPFINEYDKQEVFRLFNKYNNERSGK